MTTETLAGSLPSHAITAEAFSVGVVAVTDGRVQQRGACELQRR